MDDLEIQTTSPLWIDQPDALAQLPGRGFSDETRGHVQHFIEQGYTIFRGVVPADVIEQVSADARALQMHPERYVVRDKGAYVDTTQIGEVGIGHRIIDLYAVSPSARDAIFAPAVGDFMHAIFGEPAIAIQSLHFEYGSQQAMHQDTAYVVSSRPMALAATWIALEDVQPGTGELMFYPGGHRFRHFLFGPGLKAWSQGRDGQEVHQRYLAQLHEQAKAAGLKSDRFLARKGDVLIWHADLPHGGSRITQDGTRRSLVAHFAPVSVKANYQNVIGPKYHEWKHPSGHFFSSRHFDLLQMDADGRAPILFDGGVSKKRAAARAA